MNMFSLLTKTFYGRLQLVLLAALLLTSAWTGLLFITANNVSNSASEQSQECRDYLMSRDESWTLAGDGYYQSQCDLDNEFSLASIKNKQERASYDDVDQALVVIGVLILIMGGTALSRWMLTGRLSI